MKAHVIPWIKENKVNLFFKTLEIAIVILAIIFFNVTALNSFKRFTPSDLDMFQRFHTALGTEEGKHVVGVMGFTFIAFVAIPMMYFCLWMFRWFQWLDIRDLKRKHSQESPNNRGLQAKKYEPKI